MSGGKVYLVGAGCGAADLITVRGWKLLQNCGAVVYDDLIADDLLNMVPNSAEQIYVGKRSGRHAMSQTEICDLLIRKAREGNVVVRLKGGDPFVFGRGGEEMEALLEKKIPCEMVPGITSAIAIPAEAGIPVTQRGVSRSVHIVTAHTADTEDGLPEQIEELARLQGTLVFLMGLRQLPKLTKKLMAAGKRANTPAAVISGGNAPYPAVVRGTLSDIAERACGVQPPAVIVVGETAALRFKHGEQQPLKGITVGLTGTDVVTEKLSSLLVPLGAQVFLAERSVVRELPVSLEPLCSGPRWLVFTSANGVRVFFKKLREQRLDLRRLHSCRIAAIGTATAAVLEEYGLQADLVPQTATTEALAQALLSHVAKDEEIFLLRSAKGSRELFDTLAACHIIQDIPLYDIEADPAVMQRSLPRIKEMDYLLFSSAGGVELYFQTHGAVPEGTVCVCIGKKTARALCGYRIRDPLVARDISAAGMVRVLLENRVENFDGFLKKSVDNWKVHCYTNDCSGSGV